MYVCRMWDLSSLIWVRSLPPSPEVSGKRTFPVKYYTMILQCPRIIVGVAGFDPGSSAPEVWHASNEPPHLHNSVFYFFFFISNLKDVGSNKRGQKIYKILSTQIRNIPTPLSFLSRVCAVAPPW